LNENLDLFLTTIDLILRDGATQCSNLSFPEPPNQTLLGGRTTPLLPVSRYGNLLLLVLSLDWKFFQPEYSD
jgi:hypothetical protein